MPTYLNPPVAELIAPEIGGPATAPKAVTVELIPTSMPIRWVWPICIMGAGRSETKTPQDMLCMRPKVN